MKQLLAACMLLLTLAGVAHAQSGTIRGTVTDAAGAPVAGVDVMVRGRTLVAMTNAQGQYEIRNVPAGTYSVEAIRIGYRGGVTVVTVSGGATVSADFSLLRGAVLLDNLVVSSASRRTEKITEAPATVGVVTSRALDEYASPNVGELLARQKGVDYVRSGVVGTGINVRGLNSAFNPKNLQMNDGRLSTLVATGLPFGALSTSIKDDIDRIEIVLGPTAALYGPNAHNGLINTISKNPRTSPGTSMVIGGGTQSTAYGRLRHAQAVNERLAFKVAGEYYRATEMDWADTVYLGTGANAVPKDELELDRDADGLRGEGAVHYTLRPETDLVFAFGGSRSNNIGPTNAGRNQIKDWIIGYGQLRFASPRIFAQVYHTMSKTDSTYAMNQRTQNYWTFRNAGFSEEESLRRSYGEQWFGPSPTAGVALKRGALFQDNSKRWNAEAQYNNTFFGYGVTAGAQFQRDIADSKGTYLLDQGEGIELDQTGVYGQLDIPVGTTGLRLIAAARYDDHELYGSNFIPKGGLVYSRGNSTLRATYGKGIAAPTILNLSGNLFGGLVLGNGEGFTLSDDSRIDPLKVETIKSYEVGVRTLLGGRVSVDANAYYNQSENFISPLVNIASAARPVTHRGSTAIATFSSTPSVVLTYLNFGAVDTYGADLGVSMFVNDWITLSANYSYFDFSLDTTDVRNDGNRDGRVLETDLPINTPTHKASLAVNASQAKWFGSAFARWVDEYDFFSGINVAAKDNPDLLISGDPVLVGRRVGRDFNEGPLGGFVSFDLGGGYRVTRNATIAASVVNIFDAKVRDFVASPAIPRMATAELRFAF
jgi:outer membrane receptor for ferrienterochelin and colicins